MKIRPIFFILGALWLVACDLQPKIASIPDSIGEFISSRYPALLADPVKEPEIYNSAAGDYGVYASPELYGGDVGDYVNYAATDDYVFKDEYLSMPVETQETEESIEEKSEDVSDDTMPAPEPESESEPAPEPEDIITVAGYQTDELYVAPRAAVGTVVVRRGDTLYAIARDNNTTIADLAEINNLKSPYSLRIGQVLKLEKPVPKEIEKPKEIVAPKAKPEQTVEKKPEPKPEPKIKEKSAPKPEQKSEPKQARATPKPDVRVPVKTITVARGDTLYSLSRAYSVPVNDLAVMNNLSAPFALTVGQKLRVPDLPKAESPKKSVKQTEQPKKQENKNTEKKKVEPKPKVKKKADDKAKTKPADKTATKKQQTAKPAEPKKVATAQKKQQTTPKIAARSSSKFSWPVRGKILSHFGAKTGGLYNDGINISAAFDSPVRAAENGVVAYAGNEVRGMGNLVIIQHEGGWMTVYAHMNSMAVRRGADVKVGQKIGTLGQTGKVNKPQLHFEIRKGTKAYNPADYLK